jgi:phosphate transport system protein
MGIVLLNELVEVRRTILSLAKTVELQVQRAIGALINQDVRQAQQVLAGDDDINRIEVDIENECLRIFALTHPVAGDLRFIMAVLRINSDLERIGDKAKTIAKRVIDLAECPTLPLPASLIEMAQQAQRMYSGVLVALSNDDADMCRNVRHSDDRVDDLQRDLFNWAHREIPRHTEATQAVIDVLSISRALERIADMSTNIAEDIIFAVEGTVVRHSHD